MRASGYVWVSGKPSKEVSEASSPDSPGSVKEQGALGQVDTNAELLTQPEEKFPHLYDLAE